MGKDTDFLNYLDRPLHLRQEIDKAFSRLNPEKSEWYKNGQELYEFFNIKESLFIQYLMNNSQNQKEFNVLEVGAGSFVFGRYITNYINEAIKNGKIPNDIVFNFVSISGDGGGNNEWQYIENCNLLEIGQFKIENLLEEFQNKGFGDAKEKFDFIFSNYSFRHFVDPLGTFLQMHDVAKLGGKIFTDTFNFQINDDSNTDCYMGTKILASTLHALGDKILIGNGADPRSYPRLEIEKHCSNLEFSLKYHDFHRSNNMNCEYWQIYTATKPVLNNSFEMVNKVVCEHPGDLAGDKSLFQELMKALTIQMQQEISETTYNLENFDIFRVSFCNDELLSRVFSFEEYVQVQQEKCDRLTNSLNNIIKSAEGEGNIYQYEFLTHKYLELPFADNIASEAVEPLGIDVYQ